MYLGRTAEHVWGSRKNTAGSHGNTYPMLCQLFLVGEPILKSYISGKMLLVCISSLKVTTRVDDSQHLSLSICSCKSTALQPHTISPMTSVSMVISLSVRVCLNKLFWWPAAIQNQLPATGWLASPSPNSCLGPFNSMVKHTYCKVEQTKFLLQVMGFVASLAACDGRP